MSVKKKSSDQLWKLDQFNPEIYRTECVMAKKASSPYTAPSRWLLRQAATTRVACSSM